MKQLAVWLVMLACCAPSWSARKVTVQELKLALIESQQGNRSDDQMATSLKQLELSEELTRETLNSLAAYAPGPLTLEQLRVLEARSAMLPPPAAEIPKFPAPGAAAAQSMLNRAASYVNGTYLQLPALTAIKTTQRFQDNVETVAPTSGLQNGAAEVVTSASFSNPAAFVHFINTVELEVTSDHGAEHSSDEKDKTPWGANAMIAVKEPDPSLGAVFQQAQEAGTLAWLRWELVNGSRTAVFAFDVPRKKSRLAVNVCCFPNINQTGIAMFYSATMAGALSGGTGTGGGGVAGNFQTATEWHNFKATLPYRGEFFIDPETGIVVRMIVQPEFKPTEVVHRVDTRIDYGVETVDGKTIIVPVETFVGTEVVPNGESGAGTYTRRCTLFASAYRSYKLDLPAD